MKEIDLSYIAGLWDADGCFSIIRSKKEYKESSWYNYEAFVQIGQIDNIALHFIKKNFNFLSYSELTKNNKKFYRIIGTGNKAYSLCRKILPYLKIKKAQAKLLLEFEKLKREKPKDKKLTFVIPKKKKPYYKTVYSPSKKQKERQERFRLKMRYLNGTK